MIELVDTHCHIQSAGNPNGERHTAELWAKTPDLQAKDLVASAAEAGVTRLICVGCDLGDSKLAVGFVQDQPGAWASIGIHPHEAAVYAGKQELLDEFAELATNKKVVAIGECGLDFYYNHSPQAEQVELLKFQLDLAKKHDLPAIFHVRDAFELFWPILEAHDGIRGVLHSFTDTAENMNKAVEKGWYIGVNGIATFSKSAAQMAVYKAIPLQNLLLETDAPFLTPTPYRGTINEPKRIRVVSEFLAELRGEDLEQLAAATTQNAQALFGIK
ncbi:MAG: Preprotein translocase [Candidatus Saccharibacteria bacterium]|nr:Preprotein translocase [Candidatus Saccharibacteria bacterium]